MDFAPLVRIYLFVSWQTLIDRLVRPETKWRSKCEILEAELLLAPKCVSNTSLCMRGDSMFCIFVLHKTKVSVCVSLKTVNSKPASVFIIAVFTGRAVKLRTQLHLVLKVKFSPFMHLWTDKENLKYALLTYTSCCVCVSHTIVILEYGQE